MPDANPWSYLQPNDVARFGPAILDPAEQKRWSSAPFLGGLSYRWQRATAVAEQASFAGLLNDTGSFSWRSADVFWGHRPE
jgi:hypothetical protein